MRKFLIILLLHIHYSLVAQNYQCLQSGVKHFFTNNKGYLRGIKVDSVKTYADSTIYFPFHTPRGKNYRTTGLLDTTMGSWLGKKVVQLNDGTFLFDNIWNDTVVIRSQAHVGDRWFFYNDTTTLYYQAELISEDTMTVLGTVDSVKTILITARNSSGIVITDPVDSFQLVLSKNFGFVRGIDLYTFPYHAPNSDYTSGVDYFLDIVTEADGKPSINNSIFELLPFWWPTRTELFNWNIGDVYETKLCITMYDPYACPYPTQLEFDSVTSKTVSPGNVSYTTSGWRLSSKTGDPYSHPDVYIPYYFDTFSSSFNIPDTSLFDTSLVPEEQRQSKLYFYFPVDTSFCLPNRKYYTKPNYITSDGHLPTFMEIFGPFDNYKLELGLVSEYTDGNPTLIGELTGLSLIFYRHNGVTCGNYFGSSIVSVDDARTSQTETKLFPSPAFDKITVSAPDQLQSLVITDIAGKVIFQNTYDMQNVTISVSTLPQGMYFAKINGTRVIKFVKE